MVLINQDKINLTWSKTFAIILIILSTQLACRNKQTNDKITIAIAGKISSIDPAHASTFNALQIISSLGDTLYKVNRQGELKPSLASQMPIKSNKGMTISIPLRNDIYFHDGSHFDSKAMKFTLDRFIRIGTLSYILGDKIKTIEAPTKYLLRIKLKRPLNSINGLLTSINLTPVSPTAYANYKDRFMNKRFIGTGPYKLDSFKSHLQTLRPFKSYWGLSPRNEGITYIGLSNSTSLYGALKSKETDVLLSNSIDEDQLHSLHKLSESGLFREGEGPAMEIGYLTFRTNLAPFDNKKIRKAISYSIDRSLISKRVSYGLREPLYSLVPSILKDSKKEVWPRYDPAKAKEILKSEGFCQARKVKAPLTFRSNVPSDKLLALTWKAQIERDLSDCIDLTINGVESTTIYRQLGEGGFAIVMLDWRGSYPDPEAYLSPLLSCTKISNNYCMEGEASISGSFWGSKWTNEALKLSDKLSSKDRKNQLEEIESFTASENPYIPIWLVKPRAWSQKNITTPTFDGAGQMLVDRLKRIK